MSTSGLSRWPECVSRNGQETYRAGLVVARRERGLWKIRARKEKAEGKVGSATWQIMRRGEEKGGEKKKKKKRENNKIMPHGICSDWANSKSEFDI